jgi:hypothetical protein
MGRVSKLCELMDMIFFFIMRCSELSVLSVYLHKRMQTITWELQPLNLSGTESPRAEVLGSGLCILSVGNDRSALGTWGEMLTGNLS